MRYDTIILGGGLSALVCGISLQEKGVKCLIVSSGQSALHFFSGSFELISTCGSQREAMDNLPDGHPYRKIGLDRVMELSRIVPEFFGRAGYSLSGEYDRNHVETTILGREKRVWLTVGSEGAPPVRGRLPISPLGVKMQMDLRKRFEILGGDYLMGDRAVRGEFREGRLSSIFTENHGSSPFAADKFVMATGSFFSKGLVSTPSGICEPVLHLDVDFCPDREDWYGMGFFDNQPYMRFGAACTDRLEAVREGKTLPNVYVAGSLIGGADPIKEGCGAGVAIISALYVAAQILEESL